MKTPKQKIDNTERGDFIRLTGNYETPDGYLFQSGQELEFMDKYAAEISDTCENPYDQEFWYRVMVNSIIHKIPSTHIVEINRHTSGNNINSFNTRKTWHERVTEDAIQFHYDGKKDFVKAAKEFLGVDISAKKRADQADYAYEGLFKRISEIKREQNSGSGSATP